MYFRCIGRFVLFCFVLSFPVRGISRFNKLKIALISQVELFKPPVVRGTIPTVQKAFLSTGVA